MKNTIVISVMLTLSAVIARADINEIFFDRPFFHHTDTLAPRDDWGLLHQSRTTLYETDFAPRYSPRAAYYGMSGRELITQPAYVGALQRDLARLGRRRGGGANVHRVDNRGSASRRDLRWRRNVPGSPFGW